MNLVVGSTGILGSEICRQLADKGIPIRALVRATSDRAKVDRLEGIGAEIVQGDLKDRSSLDAACRGVKAVVSTVSSIPRSYDPKENNLQNVDIEGLANLIGSAKGAGVEHFIYTSITQDVDCPLRNAKRAGEERLKKSGLTYTILRSNFFMESWLSPHPMIGFDYANAKARIYGMGAEPISWISFKDVAQFVVESMDNPAARNATLALGGPEALSPLQVVKIFEEVGGQRFDVEHVPEEALKAQQKSATGALEQSFTGLTLWYAGGDAIDMVPMLKSFPLQLTSVSEYAKSVLAASSAP